MHCFGKILLTIINVCFLFLYDCISTPSTVNKRGQSSESSRVKPQIEIIEKKRFVDIAYLKLKQHEPGGIDTEILPYVIMPGDQLEIIIYEKLPVNQEKRIEIKRVEDDGSVFLYPVNKVMLSGMSLTEAAKLIEKQMEKYIVSPLCEINILKKAYVPKVFVFGEAAKPGAYPLSGGERLTDVLSMAGGATSKAYLSSIKLVRIYKDSVGVISIDANALFKRGIIENNLSMQDQDIVFIPTRLFTSVSEVLRTLVDLLPWYYFVKNF